MGQNDIVDQENDGALIGDSTLREIKGQLRSMTSEALGGYEGGPYYLSYLGVSTIGNAIISPYYIKYLVVVF